jgi:MFS family permease
MAVPAVMMALMPSYETIGISACFIIIFLRLMQGFAFSGEFSTTMVVLYESSSNKNRGIFSSLSDAVALIGKLVCISLIILLSHVVMTESSFHDFGWRFLFALSIVFIILVAYIRTNLVETLNETNRALKTPLFEVLKHWKTLVKIILYMATANVLFFSYFYHTPVYIQKHGQDFSLFVASTINAAMMVYVIIMLPTMGYIADIFGRVRVLKISLIILPIASFFIYFLIMHSNICLFILGILILGFFVATIVGLSLWLVVEKSLAHSRVSMTGIAHGFAIMLFGATTPMINELLINYLNTNYSPAILLSFASIISILMLVSLVKQREK